MFYLPSPPNLSSVSEDEEEYESGYSFLPDLLIFRMVIICFMSVHSLRRAGERCFVGTPKNLCAAQGGSRLSWVLGKLLLPSASPNCPCRLQAVQRCHRFHSGPLLSPHQPRQHSPAGGAGGRGEPGAGVPQRWRRSVWSCSSPPSCPWGCIWFLLELIMRRTKPWSLSPCKESACNPSQNARLGFFRPTAAAAAAIDSSLCGCRRGSWLNAAGPTCAPALQGG